jgi:pimeloyl-ACP methyl ester carboxylesterase
MLWGEKAQFTNMQLGRRLASLNPDVIKGFHEIPDTGILPHLEIPAVVMGILQKYNNPL